MVDSPIFRQQNELRDWLTGQPQVTHRKLAMLGALRILPLALEKPIGDLETSVDQWTEADALEHDQRCLAIFRAAITGTTAAWDENPLLDHAAKEARENLRKLEKTKSAVLRTTSKAASIFKFAALVNSPDILSRDRSAKFAAFSLEEGWTLLRDVSTATEREEWQVDPELAWDVAHNVALLSHPHQRLFNASSQPAQSTHAWGKFCVKTGPQPSPWQFWRDWYQRMLSGAPMDWDLQLQIALIEDVIWDAGPDAVAAEISRISARNAVREALGALPKRHGKTETERHAIGGNNPPEPMDLEFTRSITLIWDAVEELEQETEKERPDSKRIIAILKALKIGLISVLKWCGAKADLAIDTTIKWGIPAGGAGGIAYFTKHPEKLEALIKVVEIWIPTLS